VVRLDGEVGARHGTACPPRAYNHHRPTL